MTLLILGLVLWSIAHLMRSAAPDLREALRARAGNGTKGLITLVILISLVMIIVGYRVAYVYPIWTPPSVLGHVNNLLMLFAVYVFFITATKPGTAWIMGNIKNPQLTGFKIWAVAHLLVNGDLASIVLFGGLLIWAVAEVVASKNTRSLVDRDTAKISSPFVHLALVLVVFAIIAGVHTWLGYNPFGGV